MAKRKHVRMISKKEVEKRFKENPLEASFSVPMMSIAEAFINAMIDVMNEKDEKERLET